MGQTMSFCASCGNRLEAGARFCGVCGHAVGTPATPAAPGPPTTTGPATTGAPTTSGPPAPVPPGGPGGPVPPYVAPLPPAKSRTGLVVALVVVAALALIASVTAVVLVTRRTEPAAQADELVLEPVGATTPDPFTASVTTGREITPNPGAVKVPASATSTGGQQVPGSQPALYGGTKNNATCSPDQLVAFLQANPDKGAAWAGVLGINQADIATYVKGLTPILLTRDTRVTNHGFANGKATTIPAVLQAGTAVMVDRYGVPRVKCGCGNPLTEPTPVTTATKVRGNPWAGFSVSTTVVVIVNVTVDVFVLVDPTTGAVFDRPAGTTGSVDVDTPHDQLCRDFPTDPACATTTTSSTTTTTAPPTTTSTAPPTTHTTVAPTLPPTIVVIGSPEEAIAVVQASLCGQGGTLSDWASWAIDSGMYRVSVQFVPEGFSDPATASFSVNFTTNKPTVVPEDQLAAELLCVG